MSRDIRMDANIVFFLMNPDFEAGKMQDIRVGVVDYWGMKM